MWDYSWTGVQVPPSPPLICKISLNKAFFVVLEGNGWKNVIFWYIFGWKNAKYRWFLKIKKEGNFI